MKTRNNRKAILIVYLLFSFLGMLKSGYSQELANSKVRKISINVSVLTGYSYALNGWDMYLLPGSSSSFSALFRPGIEFAVNYKLNEKATFSVGLQYTQGGNRYIPQLRGISPIWITSNGALYNSAQTIIRNHLIALPIAIQVSAFHKSPSPYLLFGFSPVYAISTQRSSWYYRDENLVETEQNNSPYKNKLNLDMIYGWGVRFQVSHQLKAIIEVRMTVNLINPAIGFQYYTLGIASGVRF